LCDRVDLVARREEAADERDGRGEEAGDEDGLSQVQFSSHSARAAKAALIFMHNSS
jgi:hypothetical protein